MAPTYLPNLPCRILLEASHVLYSIRKCLGSAAENKYYINTKYQKLELETCPDKNYYMNQAIFKIGMSGVSGCEAPRVYTSIFFKK
jgi:hypothetical protein